jgi:hypothetical protein
MNRKLEILQIFDKEITKEIKTKIISLESSRWVKRTDLSTRRAVGNSSCNYDFCGHKQMPNDLREELKNLAPTFNSFPLSEIAVNRYNVGDYIGKHKDRDLHRLNLVISLQEDGDGLYIDDEERFIEDVEGQGVMFKGVGPTHSVPPVKNLRYSLIYLYE